MITHCIDWMLARASFQLGCFACAIMIVIILITPLPNLIMMVPGHDHTLHRLDARESELSAWLHRVPS
jgi:hypothetical protein